jgi:hypothetical protein
MKDIPENAYMVICRERLTEMRYTCNENERPRARPYDMRAKRE